MPVRYISDGNPDGTVLGQNASEKIGFFGKSPPVVKPTVTGSKGSNAALTSLMAALVSLGLVTDSTS